MGAIVSTKTQVTADSPAPSAVTAAQARLRHELLKEHLQLSNPEDKAADKDKGGAEGEGGAGPQWYPAGLSPHSYLPEEPVGLAEAEEVQFYQMNSQTVSTRELQNAASRIRKGQIGYKREESFGAGEDSRSSPTPSLSLLSQQSYFVPQESLHDTQITTHSRPSTGKFWPSSPATGRAPSSPLKTSTTPTSKSSTTSLRTATSPLFKSAATASRTPTPHSMSSRSPTPISMASGLPSGLLTTSQPASPPPEAFTTSQDLFHTRAEAIDSWNVQEYSMEVIDIPGTDEETGSGRGTEEEVASKAELTPSGQVTNDEDRVSVLVQSPPSEEEIPKLLIQHSSDAPARMPSRQRSGQRRRSHEISHPNTQTLKTTSFSPHFASQPPTPGTSPGSSPLPIRRVRSTSTVLPPKRSHPLHRGSLAVVQQLQQRRKDSDPNSLLVVVPQAQPPSHAPTTTTTTQTSRSTAPSMSAQKPEQKSPAVARKESVMRNTSECRVSRGKLGSAPIKMSVCSLYGTCDDGEAMSLAIRGGGEVVTEVREDPPKLSSLAMGILEEGVAKEEEVEEEEEEEEESKEEEVKNVDSLVQLLYSEIAESLEESSKAVPSGEGKVSDVALDPNMLQKIHTAVVMEGMQKRTGNAPPPPEYGENSILIAPPDNNALMKAGEFRGEGIRDLHNLTSAIKLDYFRFLSEYDQTFFYAAQQLEAGIANYTPQTLLLISSTVPKTSLLRGAVLPNVLVHIYDFHHETPQQLLDKIEEMLDSYRPQAKIKFLGIVCKGGPGHFYLIKNMPVTPAKIRNNVELLEFWQKLGSYMSKLLPGQSIIHLMESNVAGNKQGEQLLTDLEYAMFSHQVKVRSPLELSADGRAMLGLYFNTTQHKLWKTARYSKLRLFKVKDTDT